MAIMQGPKRNPVRGPISASRVRQSAGRDDDATPTVPDSLSLGKGMLRFIFLGLPLIRVPFGSP